MATWLVLAIFAQFLSAISVLVDKHIVVRAAHIGRPIVYAFYVSLLSGFVFALVPFGISWPSSHVFLLSLLNAATFTAAIYLLYSALAVSRASDVAPAVGGVSAITTLLLAMFLLDGDVTSMHLFPILLLAAGTALISHFHFSRRALMLTLGAGVCFGLTVFGAKLIFHETNFLTGFFWPRAMNVVAALGLLLMPTFRVAIFRGGKSSSRGAKWLVIGNKILGGIAAALTAFAISLGSVAAVNALAGLQFVFLYLFAILFAKKMPLFSATKSGGHGGWHTGAGVALIVVGLAALYVTHTSL